jgi:hypothetical protein
MKRLAVPLALAIAIGGGVVATTPHAQAAETTVYGHVINARTGVGVANVYVTARDVVDRSIVFGHATTGTNGYFTMTGVTEEEFGLRVNGTAVSYEVGWLSCSHTVVPTWGQACSFAPSHLGSIKLDHT